MSDITARPWRTDELEHDTPYEPIDILGENGDLVCRFWIDDAPVPEYNRRQKANARHIVHCVNNYERLVDQVKDCLEMMEESERRYEQGQDAPNMNDEIKYTRTLLASLEAEKGGE